MLRLLLYVVSLILTLSVSIITSVGPSLNVHEETTCEEFGKYTTFNPYSILNDWWIAFYYWGPVQPILYLKFTLPKPKEILYLKHTLGGHILEQINWTAPIILMHERNNFTYFMIELGDRGKYIYYTPVKDLEPTEVLKGIEVRLKQVNNGSYIGFMPCESKSVLALSRIKDLPRKNSLQDEAAKIGYKARGGKSYLYQGHEWMPIPEADDDIAEPLRNYFSRSNEM